MNQAPHKRSIDSWIPVAYLSKTLEASTVISSTERLEATAKKYPACLLCRYIPKRGASDCQTNHEAVFG